MHPNENQCQKFAGLPLLIGAAAFAALAVAVQIPAQQTTPNAPGTAAKLTLKYVQIKDASPDSGQKMYAEYCAVCHGAMAKGDGPAAPALSERPTDLTTLSVRNGGYFPTSYVRFVLSDIQPQRSNSSAQMPNWCLAFRALDRHHPGLVDLRIYNLVSHVQAMQVPAPNAVRAQTVGEHQR